MIKIPFFVQIFTDGNYSLKTDTGENRGSHSVPYPPTNMNLCFGKTLLFLCLYHKNMLSYHTAQPIFYLTQAFDF